MFSKGFFYFVEFSYTFFSLSAQSELINHFYDHAGKVKLLLGHENTGDIYIEDIFLIIGSVGTLKT